jgi:hypothetical protein
VCTAIYCTFTGHGIVLKGMVWYYRSGDANGLTTEHTDFMVVRLERISLVDVGTSVRSQFGQGLKIAVELTLSRCLSIAVSNGNHPASVTE